LAKLAGRKLQPVERKLRDELGMNSIAYIEPAAYHLARARRDGQLVLLVRGVQRVGGLQAVRFAAVGRE
jgi:hypothetical protein